jgi:acyl dehydratase
MRTPPLSKTVSADNHPIHYDVEYARRHGHIAPVVHGLQVFAFTAPGATLFPQYIGDVFVAFTSASCKFLKEVNAGDTLYPALEIVALTTQGDTGIVTTRATGRFEPEKIPDKYAETLRELLRAKVEQRAPQVEVAPEGKAPKEVINIMAALKESMQAKGRAKVRDAVRKRWANPRKRRSQRRELHDQKQAPRRSLAMLLAIRRASSIVSKCAAAVVP